MEKLITMREAQQILKVHSNTLRKWGRLGKLTIYRVGDRSGVGDRRFLESEIRALVKDESLPKDLPDLLSTPEVGKILGVSYSTIHRWVLVGKIKSVTIGKRRFVLKNEVKSRRRYSRE